MRRSGAHSVLQSSIARNQRKNNSIVANAMKIMNNALIERLREREKEIAELADKLTAMKSCPIIRTRFEEDEF
jgi:hypothetical protein